MSDDILSDPESQVITQQKTQFFTIGRKDEFNPYDRTLESQDINWVRETPRQQVYQRAGAAATATNIHFSVQSAEQLPRALVMGGTQRGETSWDNSRLQQELKSRLSELRIANKNKRIQIMGTSMNKFPIEGISQREIDSERITHTTHRKNRSVVRMTANLPTFKNKINFESEKDKFFESHTEFKNTAIFSVASKDTSRNQILRTSVFEGSGSAMAKFTSSQNQTATAASSQCELQKRRKVERNFDKLQVTMREAELSLMQKYDSIQKQFENCKKAAENQVVDLNTQQHPELINLYREEADLYLNSLENSISYYPSYIQSYIASIQNAMQRLFGKSVKMIENAQSQLQRIQTENQSLKVSLNQLELKEMKIKSSDEHLKDLVNYYFTIQSHNTKGINKNTIDEVQDFLAEQPLISDDCLQDLKLLSGSCSEVGKLLEETLQMNQNEIEKGPSINYQDLERSHIKLNQNFAYDFTQSIKQRCRQLQIATAYRTLERTRVNKTYKDFDCQAGEFELDASWSTVVDQSRQKVALLDEVLQKKNQLVVELKNQVMEHEKKQAVFKEKLKSQKEKIEGIEINTKVLTEQYIKMKKQIGEMQEIEKYHSDTNKRLKEKIDKLQEKADHTNDQISYCIRAIYQLKEICYMAKEHDVDTLLEEFDRQFSELTSINSELILSQKSRKSRSTLLQPSIRTSGQLQMIGEQKNGQNFISQEQNLKQKLASLFIRKPESDQNQKNGDSQVNSPSNAQQKSLRIESQTSVGDSGQKKQQEQVERVVVLSHQGGDKSLGAKSPLFKSVVGTSSKDIDHSGVEQKVIAVESPKEKKFVIPVIPIVEITSQPAVENKPKKQISDQKPKNPISKSKPQQKPVQSPKQKIQNTSQIEKNQSTLLALNSNGTISQEDNKFQSYKHLNSVNTNSEMVADLSLSNIDQLLGSIDPQAHKNQVSQQVQSCQTDLTLVLQSVIAFLDIIESRIEEGSLLKSMSKSFQIGVNHETYERTIMKGLLEVKECIKKLRTFKSINGNSLFEQVAQSILAEPSLHLNKNSSPRNKLNDGLKLEQRTAAGGGVNGQFLFATK